ncbi:MAG TPA: hypothetical protein EYN26_02160 [Chromatiales bacterium]|nr:hypothetical protein [Chromatiales bacterium]
MQREAKRLLLAQLATSVVLYGTLLAAAVESPQSGLVGGLIATLTNAFVAYRVFGAYSAQDTSELVSRFYLAAIGRLLLVAALFAVTIIYMQPLNGLALFGGFFMVQMVPVFVPMARGND